MSERPQRILCHGCRHFVVTHDVAWPYACSHFDFRSKRLPADAVRESSGQDCQAREPRRQPAR